MAMLHLFQPKIFHKIEVLNSDEKESYHLELTINDNSKEYYMHLIAADTDSPMVIDFDAEGHEEELLMFIPKYYQRQEEKLKEIRFYSYGNRLKYPKHLEEKMYNKYKVSIISY